MKIKFKAMCATLLAVGLSACSGQQQQGEDQEALENSQQGEAADPEGGEENEANAQGSEDNANEDSNEEGSAEEAAAEGNADAGAADAELEPQGAPEAPAEATAEAAPAPEAPAPAADATAAVPPPGPAPGAGPAPAPGGEGAPDPARVVRFITADGTAIHGTKDGAQVGTLAKGDHVMVVMDGGWGKISEAAWVKGDALSAKAVPRTFATPSWVK